MLSKRTIIGLIIGIAIIAIGGYSLILHIGTITINENYVVEVGDSAFYTIPAPNHTPQLMEITGDSFDLKLTSPSTGLQIPSDNSTTIESFKDRIDVPLTLRWVHLADGETKIQIQNTWEYNFYVDFEGHGKNSQISEMLDKIKQDTLFMKVLGSYPSAKLS